MVSSFVIYFISYILTLFGFLLGKSTHYEHEEIKEKALFFARIFVFLTFSLMFYLTINSFLFLLVILFLLIYFVGELRVSQLKEFNYLLIFSLSFFIFQYYDRLEFFPIMLFSMVIEHSFKKFSLKEIIYSVIIILLLFSIGYNSL